MDAVALTRNILTAFAVLLCLLATAVEAAAPGPRVSVTVDNGLLSLEAVNAPLDAVLTGIGDALHARVVIENVLADDLSRARVDVTLTRVSPIAAFRRVLRGRQYAMMSGPAGVDEVRVYIDGKTGYRELTSADPITRSRSTTIPLPGWPPDDPAAVARLRETVLNGADASLRVEALVGLSNIRDAKLFVDTLAQVLTHERDSKVLEQVFEQAVQQQERIPPDTLRSFASSDRDGAARAQAVEMLADQTGEQLTTRTLLRSLAVDDASPAVREAARTQLGILEGPPARPASELPSAKTRGNRGLLETGREVTQQPPRRIP